jgi:hydroxyacylglutathione hydrolase
MAVSNACGNEGPRLAEKETRMAEIELVPCLKDNYAVLMHDGATGATVLIDAPEEAPISAALARLGWRLSHILITHHHHDHVGGLQALKAASGAVVIGPAGEASRIEGLDRTVTGGDRVAAGPFEADVIDTPGHTAGHVSYYFGEEKLAFTGDTLFVLGCGRLLEGTAGEMWNSLGRLAGLPDETAVYCGHEYTLGNAKFAETVLGDDPALARRKQRFEQLRAAGLPTLPTTIGEERATNPFLRAGEPGVAERLGMAGASPLEVFAEIRRRKDRS